MTTGQEGVQLISISFISGPESAESNQHSSVRPSKLQFTQIQLYSSLSVQILIKKSLMEGPARSGPARELDLDVRLAKRSSAQLNSVRLDSARLSNHMPV